MPSSYSLLLDTWADSDCSHQHSYMCSFIQNASILRWLVYSSFRLICVSRDDHTAKQLCEHIEQANVTITTVESKSLWPCNRSYGQDHIIIIPMNNTFNPLFLSLPLGSFLWPSRLSQRAVVNLSLALTRTPTQSRPPDCSLPC